MSLLSGVVHDLVDVLIDEIKVDLRDYANDIMLDLEALANRIVKRAVNAVVTGVVWAFIICVGVVFALIGAVNFLIPLVGPALSWAFVGLLSAGVGAVRFRVLKTASPQRARRPPQLAETD